MSDSVFRNITALTISLMMWLVCVAVLFVLRAFQMVPVETSAFSGWTFGPAAAFFVAMQFFLRFVGIE